MWPPRQPTGRCRSWPARPSRRWRAPGTAVCSEGTPLLHPGNHPSITRLQIDMRMGGTGVLGMRCAHERHQRTMVASTFDPLQNVLLWDVLLLQGPASLLLPHRDELVVGQHVRRRPHVQDLVQGPWIRDRPHRVGSNVIFHHEHNCITHQHVSVEDSGSIMKYM